MQLKLVKQVATVKNDGTVQFEVHGDVMPQCLELGSGVAHNGSTHEGASSEDITSLRPLQIVMLIVGTRGDVQPFVAIGKRLQVLSIL